MSTATRWSNPPPLRPENGRLSGSAQIRNGVSASVTEPGMRGTRTSKSLRKRKKHRASLPQWCHSLDHVVRCPARSRRNHLACPNWRKRWNPAIRQTPERIATYCFPSGPRYVTGWPMIPEPVLNCQRIFPVRASAALNQAVERPKENQIASGHDRSAPGWILGIVQTFFPAIGSHAIISPILPPGPA